MLNHAKSQRAKFVWSPNGENLAVLSQTVSSIQHRSGADLHILSRGGIEFRQDFPHEDVVWTPEAECVSPEILPRWSPNSKKVLYASMANQKLWSLTEPWSKGKENPITWGEDTDDDNPVWSPDGHMLLYRARLRTTSVYEWRLLNLSNGQIYRLDDAKAVAWSPDGSRFVCVGRRKIQIYARSGRMIANPGFVRFRDFQGKVDWLDDRRIVVNSQGSGPLPDAMNTNILDPRPGTSDLWRSLPGGSSFAISPDRKWIAVSQLWGISVISTSSYAVTELETTGTEDPFAPDNIVLVHGWSPDSTKVLFTKGQEIWVVNVNDTGLQRLAEGYAPQWSPNGRHIAFLHSPRHKMCDLWVTRVEPA